MGQFLEVAQKWEIVTTVGTDSGSKNTITIQRGITASLHDSGFVDALSMFWKKPDIMQIIHKSCYNEVKKKL